MITEWEWPSSTVGDDDDAIPPPSLMNVICAKDTTEPRLPMGALYCGSLSAGFNTDLIRSRRISLIVPVVPGKCRPPPVDGVKYHPIDICDSPGADLKRHFPAACGVIHDALERGENVLVHCELGISRSASVVIAYLIAKRHMTYDAAFDLVKSQRPCIRPNFGFIEDLRAWEEETRRSNTKKLQ